VLVDGQELLAHLPEDDDRLCGSDVRGRRMMMNGLELDLREL
jgi:hypothetical protein